MEGKTWKDILPQIHAVRLKLDQNEEDRANTDWLPWLLTSGSEIHRNNMVLDNVKRLEQFVGAIILIDEILALTDTEMIPTLPRTEELKLARRVFISIEIGSAVDSTFPANNMRVLSPLMDDLLNVKLTRIKTSLEMYQSLKQARLNKGVPAVVNDEYESSKTIVVTKDNVPDGNIPVVVVVDDSEGDETSNTCTIL
jgi:hypothetical protein